jgi:4-carboxymuconolactone decarboxylase
MDDAERARQGMTVRRAVLGDAHVDRAVAATTSFTEPFQDLITRYAWGEIWSRPGLSRAERSIVTLAVLAALQHENELVMHVKAALRNGLSTEQIQEVLLQVTIYAGVPAGNRAFAVAQRALAEAAEDELPGRTGARRSGLPAAAVTSLFPGHSVASCGIGPMPQPVVRQANVCPLGDR